MAEHKYLEFARSLLPLAKRGQWGDFVQGTFSVQLVDGTTVYFKETYAPINTPGMYPVPLDVYHLIRNLDWP